MTQQKSEKEARNLQYAVEFVTQFLSELTDSSLLGVDFEGRDVVRVAAMPKTAVYQAAGLAFIERRKKGALVSACTERVVLLWKKQLPDGSTQWSGPIFLRGKSWGAGLTLGFNNMRICLAIQNAKGMARVLRRHPNTSLSCSFFVDMNGSRVRRIKTSSAGAATQVQADSSGGMMAKYYLLEACIVDVSANCGYFGPDAEMNRAIYGEGVDVQAVLECHVPPPPEFQPVYNQLNDLLAAVKREHRALALSHDRSIRGGKSAEAAAEAAAAAAGGAGGLAGKPPNRAAKTAVAAAARGTTSREVSDDGRDLAAALPPGRKVSPVNGAPAVAVAV